MQTTKKTTTLTLTVSFSYLSGLAPLESRRPSLFHEKLTSGAPSARHRSSPLWPFSAAARSSS